MKKLSTFLLTMVLAIACSVSAFAQKAAPKFSDFVADGETPFYLYNVEAGAFLTNGNDWGTRGTWSADGGNQFKITNNGGKYQFTNYLNRWGSWIWMDMFVDWSGSVYMDNDSDPNRLEWQIASAGEQTYNITNAIAAQGKKVGINPGEGTIVTMVDAADAYTKWAFVSACDYTIWQKGDYAVGDDVTNYGNNWPVGTCPGDLSFNEVYNGGGSYGAGNVIANTIYMKDGVYELKMTVQASFTSGRGFECPTGSGLVEVFANNATQPIDVIDRGGISNPDEVTLQAVVYGGKLSFGVRNLAPAGNWYIIRLDKMTYLTDEVPAPTVVSPVFDPANGKAVNPQTFTTVKVSFPLEDTYKGENNYTIKYKGTVDGNGQSVPFEGETAVNTPVEVNVADIMEVAVTYTVNFAAGDIEVLDKTKDGEKVTANEEDYSSSFRTANISELAEIEYKEAVAEAYAHLEYAQTHTGVGLMLYLPSVVEKCQKDLAAAEKLGDDYSIYNDYKEGTDLIRSIMMECRPQLPNSNQRYTIKQKASGLYMKVADDKVTLEGVPTPVAFHHVEGAMEESKYYMYSTPDRKYVYNADEKGTLVGQNTKLPLGQWYIKHNHETQAYNLVSVYGALGSEKADAGTAICGAMAENAYNSQWIIEEFEEDGEEGIKLPAGYVAITNEADLEGQTVLLMNSESGMFIYGKDAQNIAVNADFTTATASSNVVTAYKIEKADNGYLFRCVTPNGGDYGLWGANPCYFNSQPNAGGVTFNLGKNQDIANGSVWTLTYDEEAKAWTIQCVANNAYLAGTTVSAELIAQWVICTNTLGSSSSSADDATAISSAATSATPVAVFSANGAQLKSAQKGINIVRMSDGQVKKVFIK